MSADQHARPVDNSDPWLLLSEAADHAGVRPSTWRAHLARGRVPAPDDPLHIEDGRVRPRWRTSTVDAYVKGRKQGRRTDLERKRAERRDRDAADLAAPAPARAPGVDEWLRSNNAAVLEVAEALVDWREELMSAVDDPGELGQAIDSAGANLISRRASRALASAVGYALWLLRDALTELSPESEARQVLMRHRRLRKEYSRFQRDPRDL